MLLNNHVKDYVYWDNPNELVDRLKLLITSKNAGHTNHDNEIISIIEELQVVRMSINKFGGTSDSSRYKDHLQYKRKREISMNFNYSERSFDAQNKKIINVFDPENINDAVSLKYLYNLISENNDKIYQHIDENTLSKINEKDVDLRKHIQSELQDLNTKILSQLNSKITNVEKIYSLIEGKFKDLRDHILTEIRNVSDEINIHNETNDIKLNKVKNNILTYSNEELTKLKVKIDEKAKVMTEEKVNEKINAPVKEFNEKLKDINKPLKTQLLQENQSFSETGITSGSIPLKVIPNPKEVLNKQIDNLKSISNTQNNENKQLKNQLTMENHQPFFGTGIMTSGSIPLKKKNSNEKSFD
ncbi:putative leucine-rich repeat-containing protein DDB_G0290503 [Prorops nasuta]|uniref:putative leucine-rich repeat-containing protein DDB_G0290503 n=1 Tax=Prorops nasuta TaxID=863751 RepID=UPI0034CDD13C